MGGKAQAAGIVAASGIYTGGRITTNALAWAQSLAVAALQIAALKAMLDKQKGAYDDIANKQVGYVEQAINQYMLDLNNNLIPTFQDAYPDVPQAAPYTPVDTSAVVFNQMVENITNMPKTEEYMLRANHIQRTNYLTRLAFFSPGFLSNVQSAAYQITDLMAGKLSTEDAIEVLTDEAEQAAMLGRLGNCGKTTRRSLGISRMRSQKAGRDELTAHIGMVNAFSPLNGEVTFEQQMIRPENRMALALQESQLLQNSLQNIYNTAAQKPPYKLAELQAKMSAAIARLTYFANRGNLASQFVPNYAAVFGPAIQSALGSLGAVGYNNKADTTTHPAGPEQGSSAAVA